MNFSDALTEIKAGERLKRAGWNGGGMWVSLDWPHFMQGPCLVLRTVKDGKIPWTPTQADLFGEDWYIVGSMGDSVEAATPAPDEQATDADASASPTFEIGDVVQLQSGGALMTVTEFWPDTVSVSRSDLKFGIVDEQYPPACLRKVGDDECEGPF